MVLVVAPRAPGSADSVVHAASVRTQALAPAQDLVVESAWAEPYGGGRAARMPTATPGSKTNLPAAASSDQEAGLLAAAISEQAGSPAVERLEKRMSRIHRWNPSRVLQ